LAQVNWNTTSNYTQVKVKNNMMKYTAVFPVPNSGQYLGFFMQFTFGTPSYGNDVYSTEVNVIPDYFPFSSCYGKTCAGFLV
jgi:hypothetical protein